MNRRQFIGGLALASPAAAIGKAESDQPENQMLPVQPDSGTSFTEDQVIELVEKINELAEDGYISIK